jgi:hypothetical protein
MARQSLREVSQFDGSMTFPTRHIGHSSHGLFFTRLDCQSNAKPSEKDHDLHGTFGVEVNIPNHYSI